MSELIVHKENVPDKLCGDLTKAALELIASSPEPVRWAEAMRVLGDNQATNTALWHAVKNGLITVDCNYFLRLASESDETIETTANY